MINFRKNDIRKLKTLEGNILKRSYELSVCSKKIPLIYALGIAPIEVCIQMRKLGLIMQLVKNSVTKDLGSGSILLKKFLLENNLSGKPTQEIFDQCRNERIRIKRKVI